MAGTGQTPQARTAPPVTADRPGSAEHRYLFLEKGEWKGVETEEKKVSEDEEVGARSDAKLLCAVCGNPVTGDDQRIEVAGAHRHTFANPHGFVFNIGCFRLAPGSVADSRAFTEFSWFEGYAWSLAVCAMCGSHLGWRFSAEGDRFYGLVLDRLIEGEGPAA